MEHTTVIQYMCTKQLQAALYSSHSLATCQEENPYCAAVDFSLAHDLQPNLPPSCRAVCAFRRTKALRFSSMLPAAESANVCCIQFFRKKSNYRMTREREQGA